MFEVGFTEIVLILGLALLVLGPEKLPKLAAQLGRWTGRARAMARQLRAQLDEEIAFQERRAAHAKPAARESEPPATTQAPDAAPQPSTYPPPEFQGNPPDVSVANQPSNE